LRGIHSLEVLLEVLAGEIGGECDYFLDAWKIVSRAYLSRNGQLTRVFGIFRANIIIAGIQNILIH
jgi:hypothetical protein